MNLGICGGRMHDFIYFAHQDSYTGHFKTLRQKILLAYRGYAEHAVIQFYSPPAPPVSGVVVLASDKGISQGEKKYDYLTLGMEGWRRDLKSPWASKHKGTFGFNLSLAILINNVHKKLAILEGVSLKIKIVLLNADKEQGEKIAEVLAGILGNIVLTGEDMEIISAIAKTIFHTTGVAVGMEKDPTIIDSTLFLDVNKIKYYIGWMNFSGKFTYTGEGYLYKLLFPAPFVETVLLAGDLCELSAYEPQKISIKNVITISKIAKRRGFIPLYYEMAVDNSEHKTDQS